MEEEKEKKSKICKDIQICVLIEMTCEYVYIFYN